ncbi:MAG TPA: hypothetical protein VHZ74_04840 [Bryobacteraceae bacterium]|jgi:hypothetical protein|nr:hypothetical protein [Bryobacteraceae bacterium]
MQRSCTRRVVSQFLALLPALSFAPALWAGSLTPNSAGVETDFSSRYTWRGMAYSTGAVAQPYGWLTAGDFTVSLWGNANLQRNRQSGATSGLFDGGDVTVGWSRDFGRWRIEPAFEFWFDRPVEGVSDPATGELSVRASWKLGPMRIFAAQAIDTIRFRGAYYGEAGTNFAASRKGLDFDASLRQAWASERFNRIYAGVEKRGPTFVGADGSITHRFRQGIYLRAHSEISWMTDAALRRSLAQPRPLFSAGVALGYEWRR